MKLISVIVLVSVFGLMITSPVEDQGNGVVDSNPSVREFLSQSETEKTEIHAEKRDGKKNKPTHAAHTHSHGAHSDESSEEVHSTKANRDAKRIKPSRAPHGNHTKNASHEHGGHSKESHERFRSTRPKRDARKNRPTQAAHTHNHASHSNESSEEVHPTTVKA